MIKLRFLLYQGCRSHPVLSHHPCSLHKIRRRVLPLAAPIYRVCKSSLSFPDFNRWARVYSRAAYPGPVQPCSFPTDTMTSAFFYGTLMHPKILKGVLNNDASHLQICPAILMVGILPSHPIKRSTSS